MFRRKRSVRHAPLNTNPSPSAQTAALQAFRASQNPNPSLSSSAAAAALRSHTPPPTPVRDVQTKRMLRRKQSASSISVPPGNTLPNGKNGGLRRVRSSGSMTARTFRDQSPARGGSATSNPADTVPVPPLPRGYAASPPQRPGNADLPGVQGTASANGASAAAAIAGRRARSVSNLSLGPADLERGGSRNSINFSYPMNRPNSPRLSIASLDSPRGGSLGSPRLLQQHQQQKLPTEQASVQSTDKPVTGKPPPLSESRPMLVDQATQVADDSFNPMPTSPPGTQQTDNKPVVNDTVAKPSPTVTGGTQTDSHDEIRHASPPPILGRRPSTVLELQEEAEDDQPIKRQVIHESLDFTKQRPMETIKLKEPPPVQHTKPRGKPQQQQQQQSQAQDSSALPTPKVFHIRPSSISPNRLTRFSEHLEIPDSEKNLHNPPPRSLSPAKPALKSTPSPSLGTRPERLTYQPGQPGSETSEGTSLVSDDGSRAGSKKRHPKVSFEDETEVIGHGISPPTSPESLTSQSPRAHTPRSWSDSVIRSKFGDDDLNDFEQCFTPRPALPSFGSIRGRKPSRSKDFEDDPNPALEISSSSADHAIGGILSTAGGRDQSKHDANTNLQLPPEVTSLESTGYSSLSDDTSGDEGPELQYFPAHLDSKRDDTPASKDTPSQANGTSQPRQIEAPNHLKPTPAIFIQPATPGMEEVAHSKRPSSEIPKDESTQGVNSYFSANDTKTQGREEEDGDSDSDSGNSVYSDAYEDLSDLEGDGFGSIDAIVDRSVPSVPQPQQPSVTHSQPQERGQRDELNGTAESYAAANVTPETQSQPAHQRQPEGTAEEGESRRQALSTAKTAGKPLFEEKTTSPPAAPSHPSPNICSSGQFNRHSPALRPILESNGSSENKPVKAKGKAAPAIRPQRTMSNASDSSSSFKRPKRFRSTGRYTLRRTMRTTSADHMEVLSDGGLPPTKTIDHSLNRRPFSSNDTRPTMRTTLRQSPSTATSRFSVLTGRGKSAKANGSSAKHQPFKSRYEDSSDEEGGAIKLRPVRGIPRRRNETEGDSTDLDDSSEDEATRHVLRRKKSIKGDSRAIKDPAVAAAVARLMAPRDIEQSAAISAIPGPEQLPEFNIKHRSGLLGRLHLPKNNKLRRESMLRKPDITLEQPRLGLEQASIASPGLPEEDYARSTSVNGHVLESSRSDWQPLSPKLQKRASKLMHRPAGDSWPLRSNGHTAFSLPSSPSTTERRRPTVLPMQEITNGKDSDTRPRTADSVAAQNTTQPTNTASVPNSPMSPARAERSLWASRFRPSRRATDDNSTVSAVSEVHLSSLRNEIPRHEKKGRFPRLKKVFGIS